MDKFTFNTQPSLRFLTDQQIEHISDCAFKILKNVGVAFHSDKALQILGDAGCEVNRQKQIVKFPRALVENAVKKSPIGFDHYFIGSDKCHAIKNNRAHFYPAGTAVNILESDGKTIRSGEARDFRQVCQIVNRMEHIDVQLKGFLFRDVSTEFYDVLANFIALAYCQKPLLTSSFTLEDTHNVLDMLAVVSGGKDLMKKKPCAAFIFCPSPPLKWAELILDNVIEVAQYGMPLLFVSMPQPGATSPVTLPAALAQQAAELLSGIVLTQIVQPGNAVVYGGAPVHFDMRTMISAFGAPETHLMDVGLSQMAKYYGLPTRATIAVSDSKTTDMQAGWESGIGNFIGATAGINYISGAGMLESDRCQSLEKLVIDNEIIGACKRYLLGASVNEQTLAYDLFNEIGPGGTFIEHDHTLKNFKQNQYFPSKVVDRADLETWQNSGCQDTFTRASDVVKQILKDEKENSPTLELGKYKELCQLFKHICERRNIRSLPLNFPGFDSF